MSKIEKFALVMLLSLLSGGVIVLWDKSLQVGFVICWIVLSILFIFPEMVGKGK